MKATEWKEGRLTRGPTPLLGTCGRRSPSLSPPSAIHPLNASHLSFAYHPSVTSCAGGRDLEVTDCHIQLSFKSWIPWILESWLERERGPSSERGVQITSESPVITSWSSVPAAALAWTLPHLPRRGVWCVFHTGLHTSSHSLPCARLLGGPLLPGFRGASLELPQVPQRPRDREPHAGLSYCVRGEHVLLNWGAVSGRTGSQFNPYRLEMEF